MMANAAPTDQVDFYSKAIDVLNETEVNNMATEMVAAHGRIDYAANCAGENAASRQRTVGQKCGANADGCR